MSIEKKTRVVPNHYGYLGDSGLTLKGTGNLERGQAVTTEPSEVFMDIAIQEAIASRASGDHPVGAVIVQGGILLSSAGNRTHRDTDPTRHAEMVAIADACKQLGRKSLEGCTLYTTHEPCVMCAAASVYARLGGIVFGTSVQDVIHFLEENPTVGWRSFDVPMSRVIAGSDSSGIVIESDFMREECLSLFGMLLEVAPVNEKAAVVI